MRWGLWGHSFVGVVGHRGFGRYLEGTDSVDTRLAVGIAGRVVHLGIVAGYIGCVCILDNVSKLVVGLGKLTLAVDTGHHKERDSDSGRAGSRLAPEGRTRRTRDIAAAVLRNNLAVVADNLVVDSPAAADSLEAGRTPGSVQANHIDAAGTAGCTAGCIDCRGQT